MTSTYDAQGMAVRRSAKDHRAAAEDRHNFRDRGDGIRTFRAPAYRNVRRGCPHLLCAAGAEDAGAGDRLTHHRFLGRYGRPAGSAEEYSQRPRAEGAPGKAPDGNPGSLRGREVLCPLHEPEAARVPRLFRLRLPVRLLHGYLRLRRVRRRAAKGHGRTTTRSASCSRPASRRRSAPRGAPFFPYARTADVCTRHA